MLKNNSEDELTIVTVTIIEKLEACEHFKKH